MEYQVKATNLPKDPFTRGYLEAAEWAGISDNGAWCATCDEFRENAGECEGCGEDLQTEMEALELAVAPKWSAESLTRAHEDCEAFQRDNAEDLEGEDMARAGHDFYLTRNRHGAGFWDGDYEKEKGERLTAASHPYGETHETFDAETETLETR
jgi:hypothetical protein